jgi:outer membrane protein insertion porin family
MRIFIYIFFFILFFNTSYSKKVDFEGLFKLSVDDLQTLTNIDLSNNDQTLDDIDIIIKELFASELIYNLSFQEKETSYLITIEESSIVQNIFINNNEWIEDDLIIDNLSSKTNFLISKINLNNDIKLIKTIYKTRGFNETSIVVKIERYSPDRVNLIFDINEGSRSKLNLIKFYGNQNYSHSFLSSLINSRELNFYNIFKYGSNLNPSIFEFDKNKILKHYQDNGYINAKVIYSIQKSNFGINTLNFYINEGERFKINNIHYDFSENLNFLDFSHITKEFDKKLKSNKNYYNNDSLIDHLSNLNSFLHSKNIFNTTIDFNLIQLENYFNLTFLEIAKEPIIVNKLNIYGNAITKEKVIRSKIILEPGDYYNQFILDESKKDLTKYSFINNVNSNIEYSDNLANINIEIDEEIKTGNILFAGTYDSDTQFGLTFGIEDKNVFGSGNILDSNFTLNSEDIKFDLNFTQFPLNNPNLSNTYSIFNQENDYSSSFGFKSLRQGLGYKINFEQNDKLSFGTGVSFEKIKNHSAKNNSSVAITDNIGNFENINFNFLASYNTLNSFFNPTNGVMNQLSLNLSPENISDNPYLKFTIKNKNYFNVKDTKDFIFLINNYGYSESLKSKLKTFDTYSLGGTNFKGFDYKGIGPLDSSGIYLGGNEFFTSTLGYGSSFIFDDKDNVNIKLFLTTGSIWNSDYITSNDIDLRSAIGISLDFITAIGPISFSYSSPIEKNKDDKTREFSFTIGSSF